MQISTDKNDENKLLQPYAYIKELPGKNIRGKMIDAFQLWLAIPEDKANAIKSIVDELHNASLLIDDIEDGSELRRGQPVAHQIYGIPTTINCANYVYFLALQRCHALNNAQAMAIYISEMLYLHQGQGLDIFWREHAQCPSEEQYLDMVRNKTGGLFRLSVGLMQCFSTTTKLDFTPLVNSLAIYFQIRDDFINLFDEKYHKHKTYCEDLTEGKLSFPIITALRKYPEDTRLLSILKQRTKSIEVKRYAVQYLVDTGAKDYTLQYLIKVFHEIQKEITVLGGNGPLISILHMLHANVVEHHKES